MELWDVFCCGDVLVTFLNVDDMLAVRLTSTYAGTVCGDRVAARALEFRRAFRAARNPRGAICRVFVLWRRYVTLYNLLVEAAYNGASARLIVGYLRGDRGRSPAHAYSTFVRRIRTERRQSLFLQQRTMVELDAVELLSDEVEQVQLWKVVAQSFLVRAHCCCSCDLDLLERLAGFWHWLGQ